MMRHDEFCEARDYPEMLMACRCGSRAWQRDPLPEESKFEDVDEFEWAE